MQNNKFKNKIWFINREDYKSNILRRISIIQKITSLICSWFSLHTKQNLINYKI
jgi:hypothetical protein